MLEKCKGLTFDETSPISKENTEVAHTQINVWLFFFGFEGAMSGF